MLQDAFRDSAVLDALDISNEVFFLLMRVVHIAVTNLSHCIGDIKLLFLRAPGIFRAFFENNSVFELLDLDLELR